MWYERSFTKLIEICMYSFIMFQSYDTWINMGFCMIIALVCHVVDFFQLCAIAVAKLTISTILDIR